MVTRIPSNRPPPEPFVPKIPDRDPEAYQKTVWFPQRRMALVGHFKDTYPNPQRPKMRPHYDYRWFWPGERVWVSKVEMQDDGGIANIFLIIAVMNALLQKTKIVTVYEKVGLTVQQ
jgi:hypothetical protein